MSHLMYVSRTPQRIDPTALNATIEWGCPFRVLPGGYVVEASGYFGFGDLHAPEIVYVDQGDLYTLDNADGWRAMRGYTGQYGYSGPIMHNSERLGGRMAEDIVETPGVYVLVIVDDYEDDDTPAGWAVLKLIDDPMSNN